MKKVIKKLLNKKSIIVITVPNIEGNSKAMSEIISNVNSDCNVVIIRNNDNKVRKKKIWL
jgi:hypothetical protein